MDDLTRPLDLQEQDRLGIAIGRTTDKEGEEHTRFLIRARSLTRDRSKARPGTGRYVIAGEEYFDYWEEPSADACRFTSRLPECSYVKAQDRWSAACTDTTAVVITRAWGYDRLVFADDDVRSVFDSLLSSFQEGETVAERTAAFKLEGRVPPVPPTWTERTDAQLSPYQRAAATLSLSRSSFALFMDRGTGKTCCAIQAVNVEAADARRDGRTLKVLVVCPQQVRLNWQREFTKFSWLPGRVTTVRGAQWTRVERLAEIVRPDGVSAFSVAVIGYESLVRTMEYVKLVDWDVVICDESHYFKESRTQRFKAMKALRGCSRRRLILTGTPIGNSPMDLWSQLEFLYEGASGFSSFKAFRQFYGVYEKTDKRWQGVEKLIGLQNVPLLQERLARLSFSVTKKEAGLQLPDKVYGVREVQMTPYQQDFYNRLQEQLAVEIEDQLSKAVVDQVTINNVLTMLLRLAQVTSGFVTFDAKVDTDTGVEVQPKRIQELSTVNPKVEELKRLLTEDRDPRAKTIVWCTFVHNIKRVSEELTAMGIRHGCYYGATREADRDAIVDAFNCEPDFKVIVCNAQTAGEGLNLLGYDTRDPERSHTFCDMEVFFSSNWSAIQRGQAEDRAHRRGTRMPVQVVDLIVPGTIDEDILDRVTSKRDMADTVADLRDVLSRILSRRVLEAG